MQDEKRFLWISIARVKLFGATLPSPAEGKAVLGEFRHKNGEPSNSPVESPKSFTLAPKKAFECGKKDGLRFDLGFERSNLGEVVRLLLGYTFLFLKSFTLAKKAAIVDVLFEQLLAAKESEDIVAMVCLKH